VGHKEVPVTHLGQAMLEELQRRNYAKTTVQYYIQAVERFAKCFRTPPDQLNQSHLRTYQAYLLRERKLGPRTVKLHVSALRFFFVKTLKRPYMLVDLPFPKVPRRLPAILTTDEVARLIDGARNLTDRTMLMVLYSTGMRNAELRHLQVRDIDSRRMLIHIQHGKGGRDRYVPLSATLLETLRAYYRWMRPKTWLFPGTVDGWRADKPITPKVLWEACVVAAQRAGLRKRVSPHLVRHSYATHLLESGADLRTIQLLLGHADVRHTVLYLHLSQRHLQAVANPLDAMAVAAPDTAVRSRLKRKP
jgi:integrase/recombinase XerD